MQGTRVGQVRPTQLISTYGVASTIDLPQISVMVMGLDDWPVRQMEDIREDRLLRLVRHLLGPQVRQLKSAPVSAEQNLFRSGGVPQGVPVAAFPRWLVCTQCKTLAPISSRLFEFRGDSQRPERSSFTHVNCSKKHAEAIPSPFITACENGHIDDFPWHEYLHDRMECSGPLTLNIGATGEASETWVECKACDRRKPMATAFSQEGRANLPQCRGWHPHLKMPPAEACNCEVRPMVLGATNQWFSKLFSALSIPSTAEPLEQLVEQDLSSLFNDVESAREAGFARRGQARYETFTDEQIWKVLQKLREPIQDTPIRPQELKIPEWRLFSRPDPAKNNHDLKLRVVEPPAAYREWIDKVVLVDRLREVRALVGFSRIESAGDDSTANLAPLQRGRPEWVPAAEVRGEGLFLQISEQAISRWMSKVGTLNAQFIMAHRRWRAQRNLDPATGYPGIRYVLLHSLSHALIRQFSVECGYAAASLQERIYSAEPESGEAMAGILIYTAAPDSEGTLGGLVTLGETENLERHLAQALEALEICSSDPLCAETTPDQAALALHGVACHNCLFLPETSCERGNRYLDRSALIPTMESDTFAFFRQ